MVKTPPKLYQKEIKKIAQQIVKKYKPEKIILFGSFAWGKPTKDSDVDLFVIKDTLKFPRERQLFLRRILFGSGVPLDLLAYTPREVKKRLALGDFFIEDIVNKGKIIYEKK